MLTISPKNLTKYAMQTTIVILINLKNIHPRIVHYNKNHLNPIASYIKYKTKLEIN
jgi:hypothetical protein